MKNDLAISRDLIRVFRQLGRINWTGRPQADAMTQAEKMMLFAIGRCMTSGSPGLKPSELSAFLRVSSPTVTQMVNVLEARGLVERSADANDRRVVRIRLTEMGRKAVDAVEEDMLEGTNGLIDRLGEDRARLLIELLDEVYSYYSDRSAVHMPDCKRLPLPRDEGGRDG